MDRRNEIEDYYRGYQAGNEELRPWLIWGAWRWFRCGCVGIRTVEGLNVQGGGGVVKALG